MKIAIFGKKYDKAFQPFLLDFLTSLQESSHEMVIYEPYYKFIKNFSSYSLDEENVFSAPFSKDDNIDLMCSIGGDGTFLEGVSFVHRLPIPMVGINSGRLGFLANISKENIAEAWQMIEQRQYVIEKRTLIELDTDEKIFPEFNFALNELTVQKRDSSAMIMIKVFFDDDYVNTYWSDGLILSTPTGSTAYSLSLGGPIVMPGSQNFILTPVAPHNLTVRPIVIPDDKEIRIEVSARAESFLVSLDSQYTAARVGTTLRIRSADFQIKTIRLTGNSYFQTIREKLMWGMDKRN
ncbi:MAG: NAD kinase [Bacteroidia bacterium]|nr:MAG: NAD kinase [Bacteroidia bacterium]